MKKYLPEFVYGGIDGSITTFAVVSGVVGASLNSSIILILGFANLFADGFSMAVSKYLSEKSEDDLKGRKETDASKKATVTFFFIFGNWIYSTSVFCSCCINKLSNTYKKPVLIFNNTYWSCFVYGWLV